MGAGQSRMASWLFREPSGGTRVHSLDILRGFMALAVAVLHLSQWAGLTPHGSRLGTAIAVFGDYGVEGFFIVSGFCFFHLYGETRWTWAALKGFHLKRFFRIAPLYYAAVLASVLFHPAGPGATPRMLAENATLTFGLFHPNHSLVTGGWSIGLEYVFYMAFPLLVVLTRRKVWLYVLAALLLALAWPWTYRYVPSAPFAGDAIFHAYVQLPNHAFLFLLGGIVAHLRGLWRWRFSLPAFALLATLLAVVALLPTPPRLEDFGTFAVKLGNARTFYVGLCFLMVVVFAQFDAPAHPLRAPFVLLGDLSYSVYLLHPFALVLLAKTLPAAVPGPARFALALALTLGLATVVYRGLEKPAMALGKRLAA